MTVVEGAAYGGGLGLTCGGDVVPALADAKFSISEIMLRLPPAEIAPFVGRVAVARRGGFPERASLRRSRGGAHRAGRPGVQRYAALEAALSGRAAGIRVCAGANAVTKR